MLDRIQREEIANDLGADGEPHTLDAPPTSAQLWRIAVWVVLFIIALVMAPWMFL
jgi:hypothetical protein